MKILLIVIAILFLSFLSPAGTNINNYESVMLLDRKVQDALYSVNLPSNFNVNGLKKCKTIAQYEKCIDNCQRSGVFALIEKMSTKPYNTISHLYLKKHPAKANKITFAFYRIALLYSYKIQRDAVNKDWKQLIHDLEIILKATSYNYPISSFVFTLNNINKALRFVAFRHNIPPEYIYKITTLYNKYIFPPLLKIVENKYRLNGVYNLYLRSYTTIFYINYLSTLGRDQQGHPIGMSFDNTGIWKKLKTKPSKIPGINCIKFITGEESIPLAKCFVACELDTEVGRVQFVILGGYLLKYANRKETGKAVGFGNNVYDIE